MMRVFFPVGITTLVTLSCFIQAGLCTTSSVGSLGTPTGTPPAGAAPSGSASGGSSSSAICLTGSYEVNDKNVSKSSSTISGTTADQNAVLITNNGNATLTKTTISKSSGDTSSADNSNFYGLNAAVCAQNASTLYISDCKISSEAIGGNGIFSTGSGTTIYASNINITTTKDDSRGLDSTMSGTIVASNIRINTTGAHCAGLANDRGGGITVVEDVVIYTKGQGSPSIYCTGNITASHVIGSSAGSQCAVIEGLNSVTLVDSYLSGYSTAGVMLYQSTSGDAESGQATFIMTGGGLLINTTASSTQKSTSTSTSTSTSAATSTSNSSSTVNIPTGSAGSGDGAMFYATNQKANIYLFQNVSLVTTSGILLKASADSWGNSGSNGGDVFLYANSVPGMAGSVLADSISTISVELANYSSFSGYVSNLGGEVGITLDTSSTWSVGGNSFLWNFTDADRSFSNVKDNGFYVYYNSSSTANSYLNASTYTLQDGGKLTPWTSEDGSNSTSATLSATSSSSTATATSSTSSAAKVGAKTNFCGMAWILVVGLVILFST